MKQRSDEDAIKHIKYLIKKNRYKEAQELGEYLLGSQQHMNGTGVALCLQLLKVYILQHDGESFRGLFARCHKALEGHEDPLVRTKVNMMLGHYYMHIYHNYEDCIRYYQQAISLAFQHHFLLQMVVAINNLTAALEKRNMPIQTIYQFLKFNIIAAEKMGDENSIGYVEGHLMYFRIMTILRKFDNVKQKIAQFLEKDLNNMTRVRVMHALQYCQYAAGEYMKSLETGEKALALLEADDTLQEYIAGYESIYKTMMLATKAMALPVYKLYEQQHGHYRQLGELKKRMNMDASVACYQNEPNYREGNDFYRLVESTPGTFILVNHPDFPSMLPVLKERCEFLWTSLTNSFGIFIPQLLSEQQVDEFLEPSVDHRHYSFCYSNQEGTGGRDYYHLLQAQLYYKELI
ncbi:MAG: hypothetical protein ACI33P_11240 [Lysinibacillus sp.]